MLLFLTVAFLRTTNGFSSFAINAHAPILASPTNVPYCNTSMFSPRYDPWCLRVRLFLSMRRGHMAILHRALTQGRAILQCKTQSAPGTLAPAFISLVALFSSCPIPQQSLSPSFHSVPQNWSQGVKTQIGVLIRSVSPELHKRD
ncbi:hypothetical protein QBC37DRAFT_166379 [Rhypophila decipiens]|uniref:Secreted protein n=1 Tax=Rhypophila decipiens TaxID=261697 RepID=A0AAN6YJ51_9PEZI|nr:hypothetical protein QBC37DRAFT_166379 [Rhypophila decipiens]